jgi:hypothetical protein
MSANVLLIIVGSVLFFLGLAKIGSGQSGGFNLSNFGINFGSTNTQTIRDVAPEAVNSKGPDWVGVAIAGLGFLTALVGLFTG